MSPTSSGTGGRLRDESGVALIFALFGVLILGGLTVLFVARAVTESRATGSEQRFESTIHVAEAGIDDLIAVLNEDFDHTTTNPSTGDPHVYDSPPDERAWAVDIAEDECDLVEINDGEACAIRPAIGDTTGQPAPFVFGVGFVPWRGGTKTRVVKVGIGEGPFVPEKAILTNGALNPLNITICGEDRDVHSNESLLVKGGADLVTPGSDNDDCEEEASGDATSTGTYTEEGSPDVGPGSGQTPNQEPIVPEISARQVYDRFTQPNGEDFNPKKIDDWHVLCPDDTVRATYRDADGNGEYDDGTDEPLPPCDTNALVRWDADTSSSSSHRGWRPETVSTGIDCGPCWRAGGGGGNAPRLESGVYYVYSDDPTQPRNALIEGDIGGDGGTVGITVLVDSIGETHTGDPDSSPDTCATSDGSDDGNLGVFGVGGGDIQPFLSDQLYLTDRDVKMGGNIKSDQRGIISAHEQAGLGGQPTIVGAVVTEDACPHSTNSPVAENSITGSFKLDHDAVGVSVLQSTVHITAWNEL